MLEPNNVDGYNYLETINKNYSEFYNINHKKNILFFTHKGGGTEKYTKDLKNIFFNYNFIHFNLDTYNINNNFYQTIRYQLIL